MWRIPVQPRPLTLKKSSGARLSRRLNKCSGAIHSCRGYVQARNVDPGGGNEDNSDWLRGIGALRTWGCFRGKQLRRHLEGGHELRQMADKAGRVSTQGRHVQ